MYLRYLQDKINCNINNLKETANRNIVTRKPANTLTPGAKSDFSDGVSESEDYDIDDDDQIKIKMAFIVF